MNEVRSFSVNGPPIQFLMHMRTSFHPRNAWLSAAYL
ncbi:MAG: hypothetical protein ACI9MR_005044, partial [Myxococcota bacterium]